MPKPEDLPTPAPAEEADAALADGAVLVGEVLAAMRAGQQEPPDTLRKARPQALIGAVMQACARTVVLEDDLRPLLEELSTTSVPPETSIHERFRTEPLTGVVEPPED